MITQDEILKHNSVMNLTDRQAFVKLPIDERRRVLEVQAERMLQHTEQQSESADRDVWQGGDIIEL